MIVPNSLSKVLLNGSLLLSLLLGPLSCQNILRGSGILVIAVEGLKDDDVPCSDLQPTARSGFNRLCQEFLHVKGMVASSTSSVPSLAALLTGEYPNRLGVFTNNDYIPASKVTLAESFHRAGRRTGYFFSAAPLSRRSGATQGFDYVDEISPTRKTIRTVEESFNNFISWIADEPKKNFFAVISVSDLTHPELRTQSDHGQTRSRTVDGQIEELDESLFHFIDTMKKMRRWDTTMVIFVGLQGRSESLDPARRMETGPKLARQLQLEPSQLVVPTYIKTAHVPKEAELEIDGTWTHAELGKLIRMIGLEPKGSEMDLMTLAGRLQKLRPSFVSSWGCVNQNAAPPVCRVAFFDENTVLNWDRYLMLDSQSRRVLKAKIERLPPEEIPRRFDRRMKLQLPEWYNPSTFARCLTDFYNQELKESFAVLCPSRTIQMLRELSLNKALESRELRQLFVLRWTDLYVASRLYDWNRQQQMDMIPNSDPLAEYMALDKLLVRSEFAELRKECDRAAMNSW